MVVDDAPAHAPTIARRMSQSKREAPHHYLTVDAGR
jgi:hypothetical protein